jgi:uncharacterized protein (TIGR02996 family)
MPQYQAFLDAIADEPEQNLHRLVFADWLDAQGQQPRAELIRVQCQLEQLAPDDPKAFALRRRADDLLHAYERQWLGEWSERLVRWRFRRGFLHAATLLPTVFLHDGARLLREHPIYRLSFVDEEGNPPPPEAVPDLAACPALARVGALDLSGGREPSLWSNARGSRGNPDWARALAASEHIERLQELTFADSDGPGASFLSKDDLSRLASANHLRNLRRLGLGDNWHNPNLDAEAVRIVAAASFAGNLRRLDLSGCPLGDEGASVIASEKAFSCLESLDLADCSTGERSVRAILESPWLGALTDLRMDLEANLPALAASPRLPRFRSLALTSSWHEHPPDALCEAFWLMIAGRGPLALEALTLDGCRLSRAALEALTSSGALANLREWRCRHGRGPEEMDWSFLAAGGLPHLTVLDLAANGAGGDLDWLANWPGAARLLEIDLSGYPRLSRRLAALLDSPHFGRHLRTLRLVSCDLDEQAIRALARCPRLAQLQALILNWQPLTAPLVEVIANSAVLVRLEKLHLAGHPLQRVDAACLAAPGCLERLLDVAISESERGPTRQALRRRFGPRLRLLHP